MFSNKGRNAIKAMLHLARAADGKPCPLNQIAQQEGISYKFLSVILSGLKQHGLIESQRGKNGGYVLARPAAAISFGDIIHAADGPLQFSPCLRLKPDRHCADCTALDICALRHILTNMRAHVLSLLDEATLEDPIHLATMDAFDISSLKRSDTPTSRAYVANEAIGLA